MRLDMILANQRLIIEFDGSYWHADKEEKDTLKTLELRDDNWTVIRVREEPLPLLDEHFDIPVPLLAPPFQAASIVIEHLENLGLAPIGTVKNYNSHGSPVAAKQAEEELARIRAQRARDRKLK